MHHVLVIGGGPAGSTAAYLLATRGWRVALVEQHRFPRDKVCGGCLSALGIDVLRRSDLLDDVLAGCPITLTHASIHPPDGRTATLELPRPMWGISRRAIDWLLLQAADRAGVQLIQPARCERLTRDRFPLAHIRNLRDNAVSACRARYIILADGKSALLEPPPAPTGDFALQAHFADVAGPRNRIELFGLNGAYCGLAAIEGGMWNLAASLPRQRLARGEDLAQVAARLFAANPILRQRLADACQLGPWRATPLPRFAPRWNWPPDIIPIGNALSAIEPIGGEGMGLALRSAELAADAIDHALHGRRPLSPRALRAQLSPLYRRRRVANRLAAAIASRPRLCGAGAAFLNESTSMAGALLGWIGKNSATVAMG